MKRIGILGGMSAESSLLYYQTLVDLTRARFGGLTGPDLLIRSVDFAPIAAQQAAGDWEGMAARLNAEALQLEAGGAELLILATNTMHKLAAPMREGLTIPFLHIADVTAAALIQAGNQRPGLMATAFTMEQRFYLERLEAAGLEPLVPSTEDRTETHRIIYEELCRGEIRETSRHSYEAIAARLHAQGADSLILGCTEVGLLLSDANSPLPCFDTTRLHCAAALEAACA